MLEAKQVAQAYAGWIADGEPDFQAMMSPDLHDHVSGQRGPQTWDMVWGHGLGLDPRELREPESGVARLGHPG